MVYVRGEKGQKTLGTFPLQCNQKQECENTGKPKEYSFYELGEMEKNSLRFFYRIVGKK